MSVDQDTLRLQVARLAASLEGPSMLPDSTSGRMLRWLDLDLAWKQHGRPLCTICGEAAEYALVDGMTWHQLRFVRPDRVDDARLEPRCADHALCQIPMSWAVHTFTVGPKSP